MNLGNGIWPYFREIKVPMFCLPEEETAILENGRILRLKHRPE
jgi:hypothetical protein